jgi:hypothetical protein
MPDVGSDTPKHAAHCYMAQIVVFNTTLLFYSNK